MPSFLLLIVGLLEAVLLYQTVAAATCTRRPCIYIYPSNITKPFQALNQHGGDAKEHGHSMYGLEFLWPDMLRSSPYLTENPEEADYFYFESYLYFGANADIRLMIIAMQAFGPWYDRKQGADHLFIVADDFGGCAYQWILPEKAIVIHHFGRVYDNNVINPCKVLEHWPDHCETHIRLVEMEEKRPPCHKPYQYIVVPPANLYEKEYKSGQMTVHDQYGPHEHLKPHNRSTLFFFAGPINLHKNEPHALDEPESDAIYSLGVRQTTLRMYQHHPGFKFLEHHVKNYSAEIANSIFCLAPPGYGWGGRVKAAILSGCIPVIIQPDIKVEWEETLPLQDYAIRLPFYMIHKLPEVLDVAQRRGLVPQMQRALTCTWRFHWWHHPVGRSFDLLMCELKARLKHAPLEARLLELKESEEEERKKLKAELAALKVRLNTTTCTLWCGDDVGIDMLAAKEFAV